MRKYLPTSKECFVCGEENPKGLQTRFYVEGEQVKVPVEIDKHHCGYPDIAHGGVIAAILDECMGWAAIREVKRMCVTGDLQIRYLKTTPAQSPLTACAEVVHANRRLVKTEGVIVDETGMVYARGFGKFFPLSVEETLRVDADLCYRDEDERVFAELRAEVEHTSKDTTAK